MVKTSKLASSTLRSSACLCFSWVILTKRWYFFSCCNGDAYRHYLGNTSRGYKRTKRFLTTFILSAKRRYQGTATRISDRCLDESEDIRRALTNNAETDVIDFMLGRFRAWYQDAGFSVDIIQQASNAVRLNQLTLTNVLKRFSLP